MFSGVSGREVGQHHESPRKTRRPLDTALEQQGHLYAATGSVGGGVVAGGVGGSKQREHEHAFVDPTTFKLPLGQVGWYKSTKTDAAAGTKAQTLTQPALTGRGRRDSASSLRPLTLH